MATTTKTELAILISSVEDKGSSINDPHLKIDASVVCLEEGKIRNLSTSGWDRHPAAQLETSTYVWRSSGAHWNLQYRDTHLLELQDLEKMVRYLRQVTKKLDMMQSQRGYAESFGEQVTRLGEAVGATTYVWKTHPENLGWAYDDNTYRHVGADIARNHVNNMVDTFRNPKTDD